MFRQLLNRIDNMRIRTRLLMLMLLSAVAVVINILALVFLARSMSSSLQGIEQVRVRQLFAAEMNQKLRIAESALYRYYFEGASGYASQFDFQISGFGASVETYASLATTDDERGWASELAVIQRDVQILGRDLIRLHDQQASNLQTMITVETKLSNLLLGQFKARRPADGNYQNAVDGMNENAQRVLFTVTAYLAAPEERTRDQFTDAALRFQEYSDTFRRLATTEQELSDAALIDAEFHHLQSLGSQVINDRELQEAWFTPFSANVFEGSQRVIIGRIQPLQAQRLADAQQDLQRAISSAILISLVVPIGLTIVAAFIALRLARKMDRNILALLHGADRIAAGNLEQPVQISTTDELKRLAESFNNMMTELATRDRHIKARLAELETLRQVSLQITRTLDLEQVLRTIATSVMDLVEASSVQIFTRDDNDSALSLASSAGQPEASAPDSVPLNPLVTSAASIGKLRVVHRETEQNAIDSRLARNSHAHASAAFPMRLGEQVLGVLQILSDPRHPLMSEDIRILNLLADQAAVALGNARLYKNLAGREERVRELLEKMAHIQDEERRLIGLDLHDGLTQLVISANMHLNTLDSMIAHAMDSNARTEFEKSRTLIKRAIDEARRVIAELRPTAVEEFGLADGLRRYVVDVCAGAGWEYETAITLNGIELSPPAEAAIFRIVQEALSNARKHSHTHTIQVALQSNHSDLVLTVQDWGIGFDLAVMPDETNRLGLVSMNERARMLGGTCEITSQVGQGTTVSVRVPLSALQRSTHEP